MQSPNILIDTEGPGRKVRVYIIDTGGAKTDMDRTVNFITNPNMTPHW